MWRSGAQAALAQERFELYAVLESAWVVLGLPIVVVLAAVSGIQAAVIGFAVAVVIAGSAAGWWLMASARDPARGSDSPPGGARSVARFGLRAWIPELLQQLNFRADLVLLAALTTAADTGVYSVAVSVTSIAWLLSGSLATSVLPRSAQLSAESERDESNSEERDISDARAVRHSVLLVLPLAAMEAVALLVAVPLVYGHEFHRSVELGFLLLPGTLGLGLGAVALAILLGRGETARVMWVGLAVVPATIVAYLLVIPPLGATGAALASSASYLVLTVAAVTVLKRCTGLGARALLVPTDEDIEDYRVALAKARAGLRRRPASS
jgi:O-antigen/teichoic acid export membrane protein